MYIHMLITLFYLGLVDLSVEEKGREGEGVVCDRTQLSTKCHEYWVPTQGLKSDSLKSI